VATEGTTEARGRASDRGPANTPGLRERAFSKTDLGAVRRLVGDWATSNGLAEAGIEELVLAVNELTTNSVSYGGGRGTLMLWREQETLVCQVCDRGHIEDPLAGRRRPDAHEQSGRGLWLVRQLCDLVEIDSSPQGTAVRIEKRIGEV
jgi:anti-sigma regulatory factor (Ser/Thr protein kinase)